MSATPTTVLAAIPPSCIKVENADLRIETGSRILVLASSGSGKSSFVAKLLLNTDQTIRGDFKRVLWLHGSIFEPLFEELQAKLAEKNIQIEFTTKSIDDVFGHVEELRDSIVVIDDLYEQCCSSRFISDLHTQNSRHFNITVLLISQNAFSKAKFTQNILRNLSYIILLYSGSNQAALQIIGRTYFPLQYAFFKSVVFDSLRKPFDMLILNFSTKAHEMCRYFTSLFPQTENCYVYVKS